VYSPPRRGGKKYNSPYSFGLQSKGEELQSMSGDSLLLSPKGRRGVRSKEKGACFARPEGTEYTERNKHGWVCKARN